MNLFYKISLAQTPILDAPSGAQFLVWLACGLTAFGIFVTILGGAVLWKTLFAKKPSADDSVAALGKRVDTMDITIATLASQKEVSEKIDTKFTQLDSKRSSDVSNLHKDIEQVGRQVATLLAQIESQGATQSNINQKLDRWIEGELAETRRELAEARKTA